MIITALRKTGWLLLMLVATGCSGGSSHDYYRETTLPALGAVVAGLVYGQPAGKLLAGVSCDLAAAPKAYTAIKSGQYVIDGLPTHDVSRETLFTATFADGSVLYSVWTGVATPTADVTVTYDEQFASYPSTLTVSPDNFAARACINPITDLAYWYWLYEQKRSPYTVYLTSVFWFFKGLYNIPEQNAVHDYPSPELKHLFQDVLIKVAEDKTGFSLVSNASGRTICTSTFAQFPICN